MEAGKTWLYRGQSTRGSSLWQKDTDKPKWLISVGIEKADILVPFPPSFLSPPDVLNCPTSTWSQRSRVTIKQCRQFCFLGHRIGWRAKRDIKEQVGNIQWNFPLMEHQMFNDLMQKKPQTLHAAGRILKSFLRLTSMSPPTSSITHTLFLQWPHHFTFSPRVHKGSSFSTASPVLLFSVLFVMS